MMQASAPRSSASTHSTIECPPVSSSPSQATRTFTGKRALGGERRGRLRAGGRGCPCRRRCRARRAGRRGSSARTAASPTARAGRAAGRRSGRRRAPSARSGPVDAGISPTTSGAGSGRRHELGLAAGRADEIAHPFAGADDVGGVRRVRAHAGDAEELGQLVEPGLRRLLGHRGSLRVRTLSRCAPPPWPFGRRRARRVRRIRGRSHATQRQIDPADQKWAESMLLTATELPSAGRSIPTTRRTLPTTASRSTSPTS